MLDAQALPVNIDRMRPNKEWRRSAIMSGRSLRPVFSLTAIFLTWSNYNSTIRHCNLIWKAWIFSLSDLSHGPGLWLICLIRSPILRIRAQLAYWKIVTALWAAES